MAKKLKPKKKCHYCKEEIDHDDLQLESMGKIKKGFHKSKNCYQMLIEERAAKAKKEIEEREAKAKKALEDKARKEMEKPKKKCYYCSEEMDHNDIDAENVGSIIRNFHKSKSCYQNYISNGNKTKRKILEEEAKTDSKVEWEEWNKVYQYVRKEILGYPEGIQLTPYQRHKLQCLRSGTFLKIDDTMANKGYSYKIILSTFKLKKQEIINSTKGKTFEDEKHRFNYIMMIVGNSINDVYKRYLHNEKEKQMISKIDHNIVDLETAKQEYRNRVTNKRVKSKVSSLLKEFILEG